MPSTSQCILCRHYRMGQTCDAFPDRIPKRIFTGDHDHRDPYPGDHGIRFEPIDDDAAEIVGDLFNEPGESL